VTPSLLRYKQLKSQNPNAVLLYRMGDFYETFYDDAVTVSKVLDIALTSRDKGPDKTPMAGIPYHALDTYLVKLIDAGYKVAIAEQEEFKVKDPRTGKEKIEIRRDVNKIVTQSTFDRETDYKSRFLISIFVSDIKNFHKNNIEIYTSKMEIGISCIDPNGSQFWTQEIYSLQELDNELNRLNPSEIILQQKYSKEFLSSKFISEHLNLLTLLEENKFSQQEELQKHFGTKNLKSFGIESEEEISAASAAFCYLEETQNKKLSHIKIIYKKISSDRMRVDNNTLRNLEILNSIHPGGKSLFDILDHTLTRGGKRLLRDWITMPLKNIITIQNRIEAVSFLKKSNAEIGRLLEQIYDLERFCARISYGSASPRDLVALAKSIEATKKINFIEKNLPENISSIYKKIKDANKNLDELVKIILNSLNDPAPGNLKDGNFIKDGVSKDLDELRQITTDSKKWLRNLEVMEQQKTGISNLKVKYNRVFGYFLEVSKGQINKVPENFIRKQTTINGERYITTELKEKEAMILGANDKLVEIEKNIFKDLVNNCINFIPDILNIQNAISELDVYLSFASAAIAYDYCEPIFVNGKKKTVNAVDARHPMLERMIKDIYIYNDVNIEDGEMMVITGPNMGGKSTYIRMTAMLSYMAHLGSFVPAKEFRTCIIDGIFTRVGASDDLSRGESTFMMEMSEAANILRNATENSLIILDEIGRGTSTYDGMSIAWAIIYYIHEKIKAKTLFATHYHELTALEKELKRMHNYTVAIAEENGSVVFLRKIERGKAEKSFGIHVAKLAGLPDEILRKAEEILYNLEKKELIKSDHQLALWEFSTPTNVISKEVRNFAGKTNSENLSSISSEQQSALDELKNIDVNNLTPMEALVALEKIKNKL